MTEHNHNFGVEVAYPFDVDTFQELQRDIEEAVGFECEASGAGFGSRDMEFAFVTQEEALQAQSRIWALDHIEYEYVNVFEENFRCPMPECKEEWDT